MGDMYTEHAQSKICPCVPPRTPAMVQLTEWDTLSKDSEELDTLCRGSMGCWDTLFMSGVLRTGETICTGSADLSETYSAGVQWTRTHSAVCK